MLNVQGLSVGAGLVIPNPANRHLPFTISTDKHKPVVLVPATAPQIPVGGSATFILNFISYNAKYPVVVEFRTAITGRLLSFVDATTGQLLSQITSLPQATIVPAYTGTGVPHAVPLPLVYNGGTGRERVAFTSVSYKVQSHATMGQPFTLPPLAVELDF